MNSKISIIITSILKPTEAVKKISNKIIKLVNWNLIIVADLKSPKKYNVKKIFHKRRINIGSSVDI